MNDNSLDHDIITANDKLTINKRPFIIWLAILLIGIVFLIMHWPGNSILILASTAGIQAYGLNGIIKSNRKDVLSIIVGFLGMIWIIVMIAGILLNNGLFNEKGLWVYGIILILCFVIYYSLSGRNKNRVNKT